jgi:hypothetical protein
MQLHHPVPENPSQAMKPAVNYLHHHTPLSDKSKLKVGKS